MQKKIVVVGSGYVGMSLAVLLAQKNDVTVLDIDEERIKKINNKISTIKDDDIDFFLQNKNLSLSATNNKIEAYSDAHFIIIATPTNYDENLNKFDTTSVDSVIKDALEFNNKNALIVIKSTISLGHTEFLNKKNRTTQIVFSPEFLREGSALKDNLFPSRIVIGGNCPDCHSFVNLLIEGAKKEEIKTLYISSTEAEAVKLFSNSYLAMRVAFFNELDSYSLKHSLSTKNIIEGVCLDERIGESYNNPSFGYGGYCLPKDTKQLQANYVDIPQELISAIVKANSTRKDFIASEILKMRPKSVGFYRLVMKEGSDNFRFSSIIGIIKRLKDAKVNIFIHEPLLLEKEFEGYTIESNIEKFKSLSDIIVTNRFHKSLSDVKEKVFTRDLFNQN